MPVKLPSPSPTGQRDDECLMAEDQHVSPGFTGQQLAYLRDLISLGAITVGVDGRERSWLNNLVAKGLVSARLREKGKLEYSITGLGRVAVSQLP